MYSNQNVCAHVCKCTYLWVSTHIHVSLVRRKALHAHTSLTHGCVCVCVSASSCCYVHAPRCMRADTEHSPCLDSGHSIEDTHDAQTHCISMLDIISGMRISLRHTSRSRHFQKNSQRHNHDTYLLAYMTPPPSSRLVLTLADPGGTRPSPCASHVLLGGPVCLRPRSWPVTLYMS
jgi:hypothetical protein